MEKIDYFSTVPDPRVKGRCKHKLSDILIITIATYLYGGDDYASMYEFCKHRGESLKPLLELPNGCPSVDTIERVISRIDPATFAECLSVFGNTLVDDLKGKLVSIDGKRIRGSKSSNSCTHILISIAGKAVEEKSNEITAIPDVLDSIDLTGAVVRSMPWGRKPILLREDCGIGGRLCLSSKKKSQILIIRRRERCFYRPLHAVYIQHIG